MKVTLEGVRELKIDLAQSMELAREKATDLQGVVTFDLLSRLQQGAPVKTGRLKGGFIPTAGVPSLVAPPPPAIPHAATEAEVAAYAAAAVENLTAAGALKITFGTPTWISNNVFYIGIVNTFHPRRAGWVDASVELTARKYSAGVAT